MGKLINQFGGRYNAELNKATCDVLVCELPSGQKYKYDTQCTSIILGKRTVCKNAVRKLPVLSYRVGKTWGKDIVSDKWLEASVAANHCKDPAAYDLEPSRMVDAPTSRSAFTTIVHFAIY